MNEAIGQLGRIGVLMGGVSSERAISLKSGEAITQALARQKCDVVALDITDGNEINILAIYFCHFACKLLSSSG